MGDLTGDERAADAESWQKAREVATGLGEVPDAFSMTVRLLFNDQQSRGMELRPVTKYQVARLFRSPTVKSMLYWATKVLKSEQLRTGSPVRLGDMMQVYEPIDLAALVGVHFLFRRARRNCPPTLYSLIADDLREESQTGAAIGAAIPAIGMSVGYITGTIPWLTLLCMAIADEKSFGAYRRKMRKSRTRFDENFERKHWGCTTSQIAPLLLSKLGFGTDLNNGMYSGLNGSTRLSMLSEGTVAFRTRMAALWIDALAAGRDQPEMEIPGNYYPLAEDRERFDSQIGLLEEEGVHWIERGPQDISPDKVPELYLEEPPPPNRELEIPNELKDVFSMSEIAKMKEEDFDDLVDQIDMEQAGSAMVGAQSIATDAFDELSEE